MITQACIVLTRWSSLRPIIYMHTTHPSSMSVEAMMRNALAVSLSPPNTRPTVRNSTMRPSWLLTRMTKSRMPVIVSLITFSSACLLSSRNSSTSSCNKRQMHVTSHAYAGLCMFTVTKEVAESLPELYVDMSTVQTGSTHVRLLAQAVLQLVLCQRRRLANGHVHLQPHLLLVHPLCALHLSDSRSIRGRNVNRSQQCCWQPALSN
jgi:hypothetical protein